MNGMKGEKHMIISIVAERAFDEMQHPFMIKTLNRASLVTQW